MAWLTSYVCADTIVKALTRTNTLNLGTSNTTLMMALFDNSVTPSTDGAQAYGAGVWASGECHGTNWPAGGVPVSLTGAGLTAQPGSVLRFTIVPVSVANTTISNPVFGNIVYDTAQGNALVAANWYGGSSFVSAASAMGWAPPTSGMWTLALSPGA